MITCNSLEGLLYSVPDHDDLLLMKKGKSFSFILQVGLYKYQVLGGNYLLFVVMFKFLCSVKK